MIVFLFSMKMSIVCFVFVRIPIVNHWFASLYEKFISSILFMA